MQGVTFGTLQTTAVHAVLGLQVADHRFHRLTSLNPAPGSARQCPCFAPMQYPHAFDLTAPITKVHDGRVDASTAQDLRLFQLFG